MIYLDYNATTPVDPIVLEEMMPYFTQKFGNADSVTHPYGWTAQQAISTARKRVSLLFGCEEQEVHFTSGSTESINQVLKSIFRLYKEKGTRIVTCATEHKAVLETCEYLHKQGADIVYVPVGPDGIIDMEELKSAVNDTTILVAIMHANNETGVIQPLEEIAEIVHAAGSLLFSDLTQSAGKLRIDVNELGVDVACISAHKIYGPKGAGALFVRRKSPRVVLEPLIHGGGQERGLRSGTINVPAVVGLGKACELAAERLWEYGVRVSRLRTRLEHALCDLGPYYINGSTRYRLCNTTNIQFSGKRNSTILKEIPEVAMSLGSACTSALAKPSHVLSAMGLSELQCYASVRFSLGEYTTDQEIQDTIELFKKIV